MDDFKYADQGAYHWGFTYPAQFRRFDPRNHARYDVPIRLLGERGVLGPGRLGLEIGCGDGVMLYKVMRARGRGRIVGLDLSRAGLRLAQREIRVRAGTDPTLAHGSCYQLPFAGGVFDYVLSVEVIEHLDDVERYLGEIARVLRPGGVVALTTPHRTADGVPQDPYHVREYSGAELESVLRGHFDRVTVLGMYPAPVDRLYRRATGIVALDKVVRGAIKVLARWVWSPYMLTRASPPPTGWANLAALAVARDGGAAAASR